MSDKYLNFKFQSICVVIASFGRPHWLKRCINSIQDAALQTSPTIVSIRVLINGPDDPSYREALELATRVTPRLITVEVLDSPVSPASARNQILSKALHNDQPSSKFDWIYFIDDDAYLQKDHFSRFMAATCIYPEAAAIGGPNLTPPGSSFFQRASGTVLSSPLGTLVSCVRYQAYGKIRPCDETSLILCNLFVRAKCFEVQRFKENLVCAEENWLLQTLQLSGGKLVYSPDLYVWHERRDSPSQFAVQVFKYGYGRGQNIRYRPWTLKYFHLLPSLYLTCLFLSKLNPLFLGLGFIYLLACLIWTAVMSLNAGKSTEQHLKFVFITSFLFPLVHVSYGLGVLSGLSRSFPRNRF